MSITEMNLSPSPEDVTSFRDSGYLVVNRIAPDSEVVRLRSIYDSLVADPSGLVLTYSGDRGDGLPGVITQVFAPELKHPELLETSYIRNGRRLAAALLGFAEDEVSYGGLMFIYKPAGQGRDTPWHQDEAYWLDRDHLSCNSLSVWMPLDDVTIESGCMHYLPGSNRGDVLPHVKIPGPEPLHLDPPIDTSAAVPCPIPAGGATVHHCRTVHYGGSNVSDIPRRAMTTIWHGPGTPRDVPLAKPWLAGNKVWEDAR